MTRKGVWNLQQVRDKQLQELWADRTLIWNWGINNLGQLGQNSTISYSSPVQVPGADWCTEQPTSGVYAQWQLGFKTDGTAWSWGNNANGLLGQNQAPAQLEAASRPVQIGTDTTWSTTDVRKRGQFTNTTAWAIKADNTLWAWGDDGRGKLAQNTEDVHRSSPVQIPGSWSVAGEYSAINTSGELFTWGQNHLGVLGHGNRTDCSSPVQVPGTWTTMHSGNGIYSFIACKSGGTLWTWGYNGAGQLGQNERHAHNNTPSAHNSPRQVGSGTDWAGTKGSISISYNSGHAIKTDGTLWAWGANNNGQLGQNDTVYRSSPVQVPGTTWSQITDDYFGQCIALKTDGTIWAWGSGNTGATGQNNRTTYSSPIQIGTGTNWTSIASKNKGGTATEYIAVPS